MHWEDAAAKSPLGTARRMANGHIYLRNPTGGTVTWPDGRPDLIAPTQDPDLEFCIDWEPLR